MSLQGAEISKGKIGANALAEGTGVSALIVAGTAPAGLAHGVVKEIHNIVDAENIGITAASDTTASIHLHRHISEFYRMAGAGQLLYLMVVPQATTMVAILEDTGNVFAKKLLIEAQGKVRQLAIAVNPTDATVHLNGLATDVFNAIPKAQALYDWADTNYMPCNILLEGYDYAGTAAAVVDLRDNVAAPNTSIIIGQDWDYAEAKAGNLKKYADVGTALGTLSKAFINQNIGDNEVFNLTDAGREVWLVPGLSSHQKNTVVFSDLETLDTKGFIFGFEYLGQAGVRWNDDHTCVEVILDASGNINEHTIAYGRTHDQARRLLRKALLPKVKSTQPIDKKTGLLPIGVIKNFEKMGDTVLSDMVTRGEISFGKTTVDPTSDLVIEKLLKITFSIIPYGNIGAIQGTSNLKTKL